MNERAVLCLPKSYVMCTSLPPPFFKGERGVIPETSLEEFFSLAQDKLTA